MPHSLTNQLTIAEAADRLQVSAVTVRRMIARGELNAYRYGPRLIRIDPADLLALREPVTSLAALRAGDTL
ncbi:MULTISPECIES: helix-turn-helix domain-containing protein [Micrococcus]|uniref:helix-turn-helix domain-containing protein n=1 Tax=Micrococcus antarcticus TaxID=86171 RepID=UPI00384D5B5B